MSTDEQLVDIGERLETRIDTIGDSVLGRIQDSDAFDPDAIT